MLILYNLGIWCYFLLIRSVSFFNSKAKLWINGRRRQFVTKVNSSIWFHFASLGEFEQGRPVLEQMRSLHPGEKIVITFFSPSGYEIRKNTPLADFVYYLPLDTNKNAREFINAINPSMSIFTKYEYWYHFFNELNQRGIALYVISGIFRPGQVFFKWYGGLHRQMLSFVSHFFLQDQQSVQLLKGININNTTLSGDTRFDRVWANAQQPKDLKLIAEYKNGQNIFIAGSTWPPDEELIGKLIIRYPEWKFIIAPHEIGEEKTNSLLRLLPAGETLKYSDLANGKQANARCLIIDNIGMLSALYQYGDIVYIGGGFGAGIHNTLEAAAFGLPVIFGPKYNKFKEAKDLITLHAGFSIYNEDGLKIITSRLINDLTFYEAARDAAARYVAEHTGATQTIINFIKTS